MSKGSKGKTEMDKTRLTSFLFAESLRATGRERVDDVRQLLSRFEGREPFPSRDPSSLLTWAKDELPGGRFEGIPWFFLAMGKYFESVGKWDDAREWYTIAGDRSRKSGNRSVYLDSAISLAHLVAKKGGGKEARHLYRSVLKETRDTGDRLNTMRVLGGMGALHFDEGAYAEARRFFREVITLSRKTGDELWKAHMLNDVGAVLCSEGKYPEALVSYRQALEIYESEDYERGMARGHYNIASAYLDSSDLFSAGNHFGQSQEISNSLGWEEMRVLNLLGRAEVLTRVSEYDVSLSICREARERAVLTGDPFSLVEAVRLEAVVRFGKGDRESCFGLLEEAVQLAKKLKARYALASTIETRANYLRSEGKVSRAAADLKKVVALYEIMGLKGKKKLAEAKLKKLMGKGG